MTKFLIAAEDAGIRVDRFLAAQFPADSRTSIRRWFEDAFVLVNGHPAKPSYKVRSGDRIEVQTIPAPSEEQTLVAWDYPLQILYEDDWLLAVNKPAGMIVHPGAGAQQGTVVHAALYLFPQIRNVGHPARPGIVHRLDKETSGCLVVAKNDLAHIDLAQQFASRTVDKIYLALVAGKLRQVSGSIVAPITRHRVHRKKMAIAREGGRMARTDFKVVRSGREASLLECQLHSGRTHQIRVHLQHLGHPILGDAVYGGRHAGKISRQMLHAWKLGFEHPREKRRMDFEAPLPDDFANTISEVIV
jgi:23S rRNA pseudouridine1911/1915/1917 synthase